MCDWQRIGEYANLNPLATDGAPSVDNAKHSTENTKNQNGDSSYERQMFHSAKPPSVDTADSRREPRQRTASAIRLRSEASAG